MNFWASLKSAIFLALLVVVGPGCAEAPDTLRSAVVLPTQGAMSGYFDVTLSTGDPLLAEVDSVRVGGISAIHLEHLAPGTLRFLVQGHSKPGLVDIEVRARGELFTLSTQFEYLAPVFGETALLYAIGASLTEGTQRGLPTPWSILHGPAAQLARQIGLFFPLPVLIEDGFQEMTPDLMGPPPYCAPPPMDQYQLEQATSLIPKLADPETNEFSFSLVRADPTLETHNLAIGGSRVWETIEGPSSTDIAMNFLGHCVYEPWGTVGDPLERSQFEVLESANPDVVISFDLLGNDLIDGMIDEKDFNGDNMTPIPDLIADINQAVDRLAETGAEVFIANLPNPINLPFFRAKRARLAKEGLRENAALVFEKIEEGALAANESLEERAALYPNFHVVDISGLVETWLVEGVKVGDETLWVEQYGGLVGLDGLHFTDTAYALLANAVLVKMSAVFGRELPLIDAAEVWVADRERPERLRSEGFDPDACERFP